MNEIPISGLSVAGSIDPVTSYWPIVNGGVTERINRNTALGLVSAPIGLTDTQTLTNKTLTAPTINSPVLGGTITGTYTLGGTPTFPASVVTLTASQTLTNKTLTAPTINGGSISNSAIAVDAIAGFTDADTGSIYGVDILNGLITAGSYATGSVATADISNGAVTPSKLDLDPSAVSIATSQTTTSTSFTDLATVGPAVTIDIGSNGLALVTLTTYLGNSGANETRMSFAASGANTIAAETETRGLVNGAAAGNCYSFTILLTGLTPGSTTFTAKYAVSGGTGTFRNRRISVIPL